MTDITSSDINTASPARVLFVTGPSGAGRATAIKALEDIGYEAIDNMPMSLIVRLLAGAPPPRPLALGIDVRNRDFSADAIEEILVELARHSDVRVDMLYLDCRVDVLERRYSETRRRHPVAPEETPDVGIGRELDLLLPIRSSSDVLIDTSELTPHDLKAEIERLFGTSDLPGLSISVDSFSYKRGIPRGVDMVFDVRFLKNPHWVAELRGLNGQDASVSAYVESDPRFDDFFARIRDLTLSLLPAFKEEGKSYLSVALGCTGGQHRSVAVTEKLAKALAAEGWHVSTRHRELERRATGPSLEKLG